MDMYLNIQENRLDKVTSQLNILKKKNCSKQNSLLQHSIENTFSYHHDGCHQWNRNCSPFRSTQVHPRFQWGSCYLIFSFTVCVMFCRSLFVLMSFFVWPLCCLSLDLRILMTHLVSSNSSFKKTTFYYVRKCAGKWQWSNI